LRLWNLHFGSRIAQLRRYRHIVAVLFKYGFEEAAEVLRSKINFRLGAGVKVSHIEQAAKEQSRPVRVRLALEELGPTFIKLGQLLSTRPDLVPTEFIKELELLQDRVTPCQSELICAEIEKELRQDLKNLFKSFDREPLAAGSIAQVHRAATHQDKPVIVKVRRPGIVNIVQAECKILEDLAGLLKTTVFAGDTIDLHKMVAELSETILKEVDLANEKRNQVRFMQNFADDPTVHIPQVYEEYCSEGALTMEYIEGIKPGSPETVKQAGLDPKLIAKRGADFVLKQVFELGFFHADPHPGNFFILPENILVPIDFGQVARLSKQDRTLLNEIALSIVDNDAVQIVQALDRAGMTNEETDINNLAQEAEQMLGAYYNLPLKEIPFNKVITELFDLIRRHRIRPPSQFTLMLKSLMTIESFARAMDPEFEIIQQLKPYARQFSLRNIDPKQMVRNARRAMRDVGELASKLPDDLQSIISKIRRGQFQVRVHHEHLESLIKILDKSSNRLSFALIIAALLIASSLLVAQEGMVMGLFALQALGIIGYVAAAVIGIWLIVSIIRGHRF